MTKLTLISLKLTNFKSVRDSKFEPFGQDFDIYASNGVGKTTLADAYSWLLFGKDSLQRADFQIKTNGPDGTPIPMIDHTVVGEFQIDGKTLILERTYREEWEQKRGSESKEFTGHKSVYKIDGVPHIATDYKKRVESLCDEKTFRALTDPTYFNSILPWQDRRKILLATEPNINDADVMNMDPRLKPLAKSLNGRSPDDHKVVLTSRRKELNDEMKSTPLRIDEANRSIVEIAPGDHIAEIILREARVASLQEKKAQVNSGGAIADLQVKVREIEGKQIEIKNSYLTQGNPSRDEALREKAKVEREIVDIQQAIARTESQLKFIGIDIQSFGTRRADKKAELDKLSATEFASDSNCFACHQPLPEDKVEGQRAEWNANKASSRERIIAEGKQIRAQLDVKQEEWNAKSVELDEFIAMLENTKLTLSKIVIPEESAQADPTADPKYIALATTKASLLERMVKAKESVNDEVSAIDAEITRANELLKQSRDAVAMAERNESVKARVAELVAKQKEFAKEFEKTEQELFLIDLFIRTKCNLLTDRINSRFKITTFKLFDENINGGIQPVCTPMVNNVAYDAGLNHASCINSGLDVINVLSEHFGFAPPIFVDGAESVTDLLPTAGQQIRLIVSAADKTMRFVPSAKTVASSNKESLFQ